MNRWVVGTAALLAGVAALAGENLLVNPGFECGTNGWARVPSSVWRISAGEGYAGTSALVWENADPKRYAYPAQQVALRPGCVYRMTALVKVDRMEFPVRKDPVQFGLEWSDRNGKWMSGCYARPVEDNGMLKDGWVRYEATTVPMPANVGGGGLLPVLLKGAVGRVRFDDMTFEETPAKVVSYLVTDAFRDAAHAGKVRFLAPLFLDTSASPLSAYMAELVYRSSADKTAVARPASFAENLVTFELDVADLARGSQVVTLKLAGCPGGKVLAEQKLRFTRLARPPRRRVSYDRHRRLLVDGKPFFPLGMYTGHMDAELFGTYAEAPFNFALQYGAVSLEELDAYERIGVLVATDVRSLVYGYDYSAKSRCRTLEESKEAFRAKYAEIGDHPALLMWYLNDEAPLSFVPNITDVHGFLHEIDPARATLTCLCRPQEASHFLPSYDFAAIDTYPIGYRNVSNALDSVWARQRESDEAMWRMRPHWYIPQAFTWKWYTTPEFCRQAGIVDQHFPTREEMLNMNWQGIAAGANGIVMYSFGEACKKERRAEYLSHWPDVVAVAKELKACERILLSDPLETAPEVSADLAARAWRQDGRTWYLVVNRSRGPATGTVRLTDGAAGVETVVGSGARLSADGRSLVCAFGPIGYTLVEVKGETAR